MTNGGTSQLKLDQYLVIKYKNLVHKKLVTLQIVIK